MSPTNVFEVLYIEILTLDWFWKEFQKSPAATLVYLEDEQLMLEWAFRKMSPSLKEHFSYLLPKAAASLDF